MKRKKALSIQVPLPALGDAYTPTISPAFCDYMEASDSSISRSDSYDSDIGGHINFPNIKRTSSPFKMAGGGSRIDVREAISLCVQAYWAFPLLRNITEIQVEFSNSQLILSGGNKKTNTFVQKWFEKININKIAERFFREWFRSANAHIYRIEGKITDVELNKMKQIYGSEISATIPVDYRILNPETIIAGGEYYLNNPIYYKILSPFEAEKLGLMKKKDIKDTLGGGLQFVELDGGLKTIQLDPKNLISLLYKAQDYEVAGIPYAYGALEDIEAKLELKRIDLAVARTVERTLLHLKVGETPNEYNQKVNINPNTIAALQGLFNSNSVGRVLVSDYTVNAEWLIPEVDKILGEEKYKQIDKDITIALNAILFGDGGEKYSNLSIKTKVFFERLKEARNAFVNEFLQKEVKRVCQAIGAKNYPKVSFEELSLKDELQSQKLFVSMAQMGMLTPEETLEAMQTGKLPTPEESIDSQRDFRKLREEYLYLPIVGGASELQKVQIEKGAQSSIPNNSGKSAGRPDGSSGTPKSSVKVSPRANAHSAEKFKELMIPMGTLYDEAEKQLKKKYKVKILSEDQKKIVSSFVVEPIMSNEKVEDWKKMVASYIEEPRVINEVAQREIEDLQIKHNLDSYSAAILRLTTIKTPE